MPYGYIPSPFGGRPSSVDIAKAVKRDEDKDQAVRDEDKDQAVRDARVTPQSRANKIDNAEFLKDFLSGKDHDTESDRGLPPDTLEQIDKSEDDSEEDIDDDQIELIRTTPPYYGRDGMYESYKFKTVEGKKHDDDILGAMRTPRMKAEVTGGERLPDEDQSESYYAEWEHPVENTPKGRDKKALDAKIPTPWGKDSYARQSSSSDESLYEELDDDRRDSIGYSSDGYDVREDWESTRKSASEPIDKAWPYVSPDVLDASRTPNGRGRAVSRKEIGFEPYSSELTRVKTEQDVSDEGRKNIDGNLSMLEGKGRGDLNPQHKGSTPKDRAHNQKKSVDRENDEEGKEKLRKSEDESIDKGSRIRPLIPNETPEDKAKVTPQGRARNVSRDSNGDRATSSGKSRTYTMDDALELKEVAHRVNPEPSGDLTTADGGSASTSPYGRETNQFYGGSPSRVNEADYDEGVMDFVGKENKYTKSESSPVAKSINQMIYERVYKTAPYSIYERRM